jgi:hypothetical protein
VELGERGGVELRAGEGGFGILVCLGVGFIVCRRNLKGQLEFSIRTGGRGWDRGVVGC